MFHNLECCVAGARTAGKSVASPPLRTSHRGEVEAPLLGVLFQVGRCVGIVEFAEIDGLEVLFNALENAEERGHDENLADHADEHTADGSRPEGAVAVGTDPKGEHHGEQTDDHGHGGHQNRAQTSGGTVLR